jgi:hypothetical protein
VVDGNWRHAGAEEIPCEQVREQCFLGSGFWQSSSDPVGTEWELREREREGWGLGGWESKVSSGSTPDPSHSTKMLGKTLLTKKAHEKSLTSNSKV